MKCLYWSFFVLKIQISNKKRQPIMCSSNLIILIKYSQDRKEIVSNLNTNKRIQLIELTHCMLEKNKL